MKFVAVIPCYNEEQSIGDLVFLVNTLIGFSIVADDGSNDKTVEKAEESGAYVVRNFTKRGVGFNTKSGIEEALMIKDCDVVVTLDGDGQHNPEEMPIVIEPIEKGEADVVIGSRFLGKNNSKIPKYRKFGIKVITWLCNVGSGTKFTDAQCCFRAYRREVLERMNISERGFTFSVETLIKARHMGFRIKEVSVNVLYHKQFSQNSSLNPVRHGVSVAFGTVKWRLKIELLPKIKRIIKR